MSNRLSVLRHPTTRTTAWLTALEQSKRWRSRTLARVLRRPDLCDEFDLALGEADDGSLGNSDLVLVLVLVFWFLRLRGTSHGGVA